MAQIIQFPGVQSRQGWATVNLNAKRPVDFPDGLFLRAREALRFVQDLGGILQSNENPEAAIDALVDRLLDSGVMRYDEGGGGGFA